LRRLDLTSGKLHSELKFDAVGGSAITQDGRTLLFHAGTVFRTNYVYNDLYAYDRVTQQQRRLTFGQRATNPAVSPDGTRVVFEVNHAGARGLGLVSAQGGRVELLLPPSGFEQAYTPTFSPDGRRIAFSWWRSGGFRDIWLLDLATRQLEPLT